MTIIPKINGTPNITTIVLNNSIGSTLISFISSAVGAYIEPIIAKFKGVRMGANNVELAVSVTDKATFPLASELRKLLIFPPGHAPNKKIPRAILGQGFMIITIRKVSRGSTTYCDKIPARAFLGCSIKRLKCSSFKSRAMPNIKNANKKFNRNKSSGLKLSLILSIVSHMALILTTRY